jgi:hypothetical protein
MPRKKEFATAADRQKAYRLRVEQQITPARELLNAIVAALDRGDCSKIADNLPENDSAAMRELAKRLDQKQARLVVFSPKPVKGSDSGN